MSVKYRKVVNNRKNSKTKGKVYGRAVVDGVIDTKEIARKINKRCTLTEPDIIAVINALETEIGYGLSDGKRVVLDGFGSFKVGLTTPPSRQCQEVYQCQHQGHARHLPACHRDGTGQAREEHAERREGRGDDRIHGHRVGRRHRRCGQHRFRQD